MAENAASPALMDVLLLAGCYQVRGSCAYTLRLLQHLPAQGIAPRNFCPDAEQVAEERRSKLSIREFPYLDNPFVGRVVLRMIRRELMEQPPQLIHVQSRRMHREGAWLARMLRRPYLLTMHDFLRPQEKLRIDHTWCRKIIAVSDAVKADLIKRTGLSPELVAVITSGVEVDRHAAYPAPLDPAHVPVVGTAGPLEAMRGLPFFLSAAQQVLASGRDVEFLVAGAGPEESNLRRLSREMGISQKVTFVPYVLDFTDSLAAMDIFCLPSLQQGLGTVMLEAMALGRPVIATGVGGVYSIVRDGQTGLMVPPSNSQELAQKIIQLLDDRARAREIGTAARQLVEDQFNVTRMVQQTADLYRQIIAQEPPVETPAATMQTVPSRMATRSS